MKRTKMPKLRNGCQVGFEPGLSRLRVRHSTTEVDMLEMAGEVGVKWTGRLHTTQSSTESVGEGFRRKDQEKSRR